MARVATSVVRLRSRLPGTVAALPVAVGKAVREGAEAIARDAAQRAPDRTPYGEGLPASIKVGTGEIRYGTRSRFALVAGDFGFSVPTGRSAVTDTAFGIWAAWYWHFLEYGTQGSDKRPFSTPAKPFMMPALEGRRDEVVSLVAAALRGV